MSDQHFIDGLEAVVKMKGGGHIAAPTYTNGATPECIVAWAVYYAYGGFALGTLSGCANTTLERVDPTLSDRVRYAARAAQIVQDINRPWAEAMDAFRQVMEKWDPNAIDPKFGAYLYGEKVVSDVIAPWVEKRTAEHLAYMEKQKADLAEKTGAVVAKMDAVVASWDQASFTYAEAEGVFPEVTVPKGGFTFTGFNDKPVVTSTLQKKDHALTA